MARYDFTAQATADLREIGHYTKKTWGGNQAGRYRQEFELALQKLSLTPDVGRRREEIAPKLRSFKVVEHIAFYIPRRGGITIVRLLRRSMDVESAFEKQNARDSEPEI